MSSAYSSFRKDGKTNLSGASKALNEAFLRPVLRQENVSANVEDASHPKPSNINMPSSRRMWSVRSVLAPEQDEVFGKSLHQKFEGPDHSEKWPGMNLLGMDPGGKASLLNFNASGFQIEERDLEFLDAPGGYKVPAPSSHALSSLKPAPYWIQLLWILTIGWWSFITYGFMGVLMFAVRCRGLSRFCFSMSRWMLLPISSPGNSSFGQSAPLSESSKTHHPSAFQQSLFLKGRWDSEFQFSSSTGSSFVWRFFAAPVCSIVHAAAACLCWIVAVLLPMSTVNVFILRSLWDFNIAVPDTLRRRSYLLHLRFGSWKYCSYSVYGVNIIMLNLTLLVISLLIRGYIPSKPYWFSSQSNCTIYFVLGFIAVIPLGNLIHVSLYRLCKKTNPLYGFVANALFHAIIEISVYIYLLEKTNSNPSLMSTLASVLVNERLTGSMMFNLAFIPGVAMVVGGLKHHQQVFNRYQVVTNNLLIFVSICLFVMPTLFYQLVIAYLSDLQCQFCTSKNQVIVSQYAARIGGYNYTLNCYDCYSGDNIDINANPIYDQTTKPISITVSIFLPLLYIVGMIFTLRTHYNIIEEEEHLIHELLHHNKGNESLTGDSDNVSDLTDSIGVHSFDLQQHDDGQISKEAAYQQKLESVWSTRVCVLVFIVSLAMFGFIIEKVAESIPKAIVSFGFTNVFTATSILSWAPAIPDLILAVLFARQNDVSAAIDVGLAASLTITMIQFPLLVWIASILSAPSIRHWGKYTFTPVFNFIDIAMLFLAYFAIFMVSLQGKSNYLVGLCLVLMYITYLLINWYE